MKMSQSNKKNRRTHTKEDLVERKRKRNNMILGIFMLVIMVFGTAGWAMMSGGGASTSTSTQLPKDYPLTQYQLEDGSYIWFIVKNYQDFYFASLDSFQGDLGSQGLVNSIKENSVVSIYLDGTFTEEQYLLEKALTALEISYTQAASLDCSQSNQIVLTSNSSITGDCIEVVVTQENSYSKVESLVYYLVKD